MHARMHVYGWRDVWMSGGRTHKTVCNLYPISQQALLSPLPACTHACVQCMRSACVAPSLRIRQASSSLRAQGGRGRGITRNLPFSSLHSLRLRRQPTQTTHTVTCLPASQPVQCLPAPGSWCQCLSSSPHPAARAVPRHNTHHAYILYILYFIQYYVPF